MNLVDTVVKNHMLDSPSMFADRMSVLVFILFNSGGGYQWNADGTAGCIYGMPKETSSMNLKATKDELATLDEMDNRLAGKGVDPENISSVSAYRRAELELELLTLKHRAKNIGVYASKNDVMKKWQPDQLLGATFGSLQKSLVGTLPKTLHPDWAKAADEVVCAALESLRQSKEDGKIYPDQEKLTKQLNEALDVLEPITHRREKMAKAALQLKGLWDSLTPER